jgi:CDP-paratose 2-epimerase
VERAVASCDSIYHFAAQVAVTTSLLHPVADLEVNLIGTINVLEAARKRASPPTILFTSTNKVYGDLRDVKLMRRDPHVYLDGMAEAIRLTVAGVFPIRDLLTHRYPLEELPRALRDMEERPEGFLKGWVRYD